MSGPLDNPISGSDPDPGSDDVPEEQYPPEAGLPAVLRGRMFCTLHGRECYRSAGFAGENVWICPDERHVRPLS